MSHFSAILTLLQCQVGFLFLTSKKTMVYFQVRIFFVEPPHIFCSVKNYKLNAINYKLNVKSSIIFSASSKKYCFSLLYTGLSPENIQRVTSFQAEIRPKDPNSESSNSYILIQNRTSVRHFSSISIFFLRMK